MGETKRGGPCSSWGFLSHGKDNGPYSEERGAELGLQQGFRQDRGGKPLSTDDL